MLIVVMLCDRVLWEVFFFWYPLFSKSSTVKWITLENLGSSKHTLTNDKSSHLGKTLLLTLQYQFAPTFFPTDHQVCLLQRTILLRQSAHDIFWPPLCWNREVNTLRMKPVLRTLSGDMERAGTWWCWITTLIVSESQPALDSPVLWDRKVPFIKAS